MAFDYVRIAFFDEFGESPERVSLGFFHIVRIDNDQFIPAGVVRQSDAHDVIGVTGPSYGKHLNLHSLECFECQIFEQCAPRGREIMLNRIGEREEVAPAVFESVAERDQFLPAIDRDKPAVLQIPLEFFGLNAKIDNV